MSEIDEKIISHFNIDKNLTKIKNVGGQNYRVNVYKKFNVDDSVITRTRMDKSYYLRIDSSGNIHNLTLESKVKAND